MPSWTGCTKPMASSTSCASSSNSVPAIGLNLSSTCTQCSFCTLPSTPENFCVSTANSRLAPSAWLDEVRIFKGQFGQVTPLFSCSGGGGMISSCVTDSAPCRNDLPMQSDPVSPPPITTTCLPPAKMSGALPSGSLEKP